MKTSERSFWNTFKKVADKFVAKKDNGGDIAEGFIRTRSGRVCPVCAVANYKLKKLAFNLNYGKAAEEIGLDAKFAAQICLAADERVARPYRLILLQLMRKAKRAKKNS